MRVALYARVSTDEQAERYGLSSQLTELRALAGRKGYAVVGEFSDEGISGATLDRPQLDRLRELVRHRAVDVVLATWRNGTIEIQVALPVPVQTGPPIEIAEPA